MFTCGYMQSVAHYTPRDSLAVSTCALEVLHVRVFNSYALYTVRVCLPEHLYNRHQLIIFCSFFCSWSSLHGERFIRAANRHGVILVYHFVAERRRTTDDLQWELVVDSQRYTQLNPVHRTGSAHQQSRDMYSEWSSGDLPPCRYTRCIFNE